MQSRRRSASSATSSGSARRRYEGSRPPFVDMPLTIVAKLRRRAKLLQAHSAQENYPARLSPLAERGHLPSRGQGRSPSPAEMRHARDEPALGRGRASRGSRSPRGHPDGPGRVAPRQGSCRSRQSHAWRADCRTGHMASGSGSSIVLSYTFVGVSSRARGRHSRRTGHSLLLPGLP